MRAAEPNWPAAPARPLPARRQRLAFVPVLALHVALVALLPSVLRQVTRGPAPTVAPRTTWLRLLPYLPGSTSPQPPLAPWHPLAAATVPVPTPQAITQQDPAAPAAVGLPAVSTSLRTEAAINAAAAASGAASAPLDLRWQGWGPRKASAAEPARDDPRLHSHPSRDDRLARALGTDDTVHETANPDGTRIFRRGSRCTTAMPSREGQLEPFNQSTLPRPRLIDEQPC